SSAYDSVFSILYAVWKTNPEQWSYNFSSINNDILENICNGSHDLSGGLNSLEHVRDRFRHELDNLRIAGLWDIQTSVVRLLQLMFATPTQIVSSQLTCSQGHTLSQAQTHQHLIQSCILSAGTNPYVSIQDWIQKLYSWFRCLNCNQHLIHSFSFSSIPAIILFEFEGKTIKNRLRELSIMVKHIILGLRTVPYTDALHYTLCIIVNQQLWYHDGITTGADMVYEGLLQSATDLMHCRGKEATVAIY
ncbi:hypothetical protein L208DRAFT_1021078, partial [Tricholoma matsutake]